MRRRSLDEMRYLIFDGEPVEMDKGGDGVMPGLGVGENSGS